MCHVVGDEECHKRFGVSHRPESRALGTFPLHAQSIARTLGAPHIEQAQRQRRSAVGCSSRDFARLTHRRNVTAQYFVAPFRVAKSPWL